jgi:cbb3-type cytochrome oxidase subunit 3
MWLLILEALAALALLLGLVWWTMFSGRRRGERADSATAGQDASDERR